VHGLPRPTFEAPQLFQTHHGAGGGGWRVVAYYYFRSMPRRKCAGYLPFLLRIVSKRTQRRAYTVYPLRDGSEKDEGFPHRARETMVARYKRWQLVVIGWRAKRKVIGFFGHVTEQASGWREGEANPAKAFKA
jgi:hypothetical protein